MKGNGRIVPTKLDHLTLVRLRCSVRCAHDSSPAAVRAHGARYQELVRQCEFDGEHSEGSRASESFFGLRPQNDSFGKQGLVPTCPDMSDRLSIESGR
jgi:hypothetical protein